MSVLLKKVIWFRANNPDDPVTLLDVLEMKIGRGLDIKNNVLQLRLKNTPVDQDSNGNLLYQYVDEEGTLKFQEDDQVKVYLRYADDMADVEDVVWGDDPTQTPSSDYLKGVYFVVDFDTTHQIKDTSIKLKCADKSFILLNRLLARAFIIADAKTAPLLVQKIVRFSSQANTKIDANYYGDGADGTGGLEDDAVIYNIDARLESVGGHIQDTRRATKEDGSVNSDTTFPIISIAKVWKPVYEWMGEVSQIENLNTEDELTGVHVYGRPFIFWVDELNRFHWVETNDTITTSDNITIGTTSGIISHKIEKSVFDVINFITYRGGEDLFGQGTLDFEVDEKTNVKNLKMRVIAMIDIAKKLIQDEIRASNLVENAAGAFWFSGKNYDALAYPLTPLWSSTTVANDDAYNDSLRTEILRMGQTRARRLINKLTGARFKGPVDRKGITLTMGNLLEFTDLAVGINKEKLRIVDTRDTINKSGWFTQVNLEQDPKAIIEAS